jgi:hypothetical protein
LLSFFLSVRLFVGNFIIIIKEIRPEFITVAITAARGAVRGGNFEIGFSSVATSANFDERSPLFGRLL